MSKDITPTDDKVQMSDKPKPKKKSKVKPYEKTYETAGRPKSILNLVMIYDLAKIGCTLKEIANIAKCDVSTLQRNAMPVIHEGWDEMKSSLRRTQLDVALTGKNTQMLIWLGKQQLGQKESPVELSGIDGSAINTNMTIEFISAPLPTINLEDKTDEE